MNDPARLKDVGTEAQKALLRSAPPMMPPQVHEQVRWRVERHMGFHGLWVRATRWAVAMGLTLAAGGALAYGVVRTRVLSPSAPALVRPPEPAPTRPRVQPVGEPRAEAPLEEAPLEAPKSAPRRRQRGEAPTPPQLAVVTAPPPEPAPAAAPEPHALSEPRLSFQDLVMEGLAEEPRTAAESPTRIPERLRPARLLVNWEGRRGVRLDVMDMRATGAKEAAPNGPKDGLARIEGTVNRTPLSLDIRRGLMTGKIGDEVVNLWLKGEESADGSIAGYPVSFVVLPIQNGYLLRGNLPGHTARLEVRRGILRWYPGCENALASTGAGVYQGTCAQGKHASVVLPPNFRQLPPLARLITLALVLTERDPVFKHSDPQLFNVEP